MIIAVDFDHTLHFGGYDKRNPDKVGFPNRRLIKALVQAKEKGAKLILYTCREKKALKSAVRACLSWGLEFDAVNDNVEESKQWAKANGLGRNTRKVFSDILIDDGCFNLDVGLRYVELWVERPEQFNKEFFVRSRTY